MAGETAGVGRSWPEPTGPCRIWPDRSLIWLDLAGLRPDLAGASGLLVPDQGKTRSNSSGSGRWLWATTTYVKNGCGGRGRTGAAAGMRMREQLKERGGAARAGMEAAEQTKPASRPAGERATAAAVEVDQACGRSSLRFAGLARSSFASRFCSTKRYAHQFQAFPRGRARN